MTSGTPGSQITGCLEVDLVMGLVGLIMACYVDLWRILTRHTKSMDHPSIGRQQRTLTDLKTPSNIDREINLAIYLVLGVVCLASAA